MFIRTKKTPRSKSISVQLVESFRENGKIKQRVVSHVGTANTKEKTNELIKLAEAFKTELHHLRLTQQKNRVQPKHRFGVISPIQDNFIFRAVDLEEENRTILGIHDIYGYLYDYLGFSNPFSHPARRTYAANILKEIVLARIACPKSKRASVELLSEKFAINLNLDHVYQMMDKVDDRFFENIQKIALAASLKLTGGKLRVLFYDATTLYFESFSEDILKQNGYSKDMKFNQPQVLLALFVTDCGLPVGYEVFPGSTFEGHTLIPVLEKLKTRYQLEEVVFVADRGLFSEANLAYLEENRFKYIVGARIKNTTKKIQAEILKEKNYDFIDNRKEQRIATFNQNNSRKLIVHYDAVRARKDAYDREKAIKRLTQKISKSKNPKSLLNNFGYKKYIEVKGDTKIIINHKKIELDRYWDGLLGIITNISDYDSRELLMHYRNLWHIEESFRINKHDLRMRPIFHWSPKRVQAHIGISFIAFVCVRYLEYRLSVQSQKISPEEIRKALLEVQASVLHDQKSGKRFLLPAKINNNAKEIYRIMKVKLPKKIMVIE
jgi:transposase